MHEAKRTFTNIIRNTPLHGDDCQHPWVTVLSAIILGGDPTVPTSDPPLTLAASHKNTLLVKALLSLGVDIDCQDHDGASALFHAIVNGDTKTAEVHLKAGANTDLAANGDVTPLHAAAERSSDMVRLLLKYHANPRAQDSMGRTPADCARMAHCRPSALLLEQATHRTPTR